MLLVFVLAMVANDGAWEACFGGPNHATILPSWDRHDPTTEHTVPTTSKRIQSYTHISDGSDTIDVHGK